MQDRRKQVGIDRIIQLDWLEKTASLVMAGNDKEVIEKELQELLKDQLSGGVKGVRGSREKTITVLMRVWFRPPDYLEELKKDGLLLLQRLPLEDHLPVHWGMMLAAYPFWNTVSSVVGRLLQLQESFSTSQVMRRVVELYGERQTVTRAAQRFLRSLTDWGMLDLEKGKASFKARKMYSVSNKTVTSWMVEAFLYGSEKQSGSPQQILSSPALFPFCLPEMSAKELCSISPRLKHLRHSINSDLMQLS